MRSTSPAFSIIVARSVRKASSSTVRRDVGSGAAIPIAPREAPTSSPLEPSVIDERLERPLRGPARRRVELVVVGDADQARVLGPDQDVERQAGSLEAVDDPDTMGVAGRVTAVRVRADDAGRGELGDPLRAVADEGRELVGGQRPCFSLLVHRGIVGESATSFAMLLREAAQGAGVERVGRHAGDPGRRPRPQRRRPLAVDEARPLADDGARARSRRPRSPSTSTTKIPSRIRKTSVPGLALVDERLALGDRPDLRAWRRRA